MPLGNVFAYLLGLILLYIIGMLLVIPIRVMIKLIVNGIIGGVVLFLFNLVGGIFGLSLAVNPLNAIVVGILGVPGVVLLLILQVIL